MSYAESVSDTIAAVATPPGSGGVGIVRVSGPGALGVADLLFTSARPDFTRLRPYRLHHGHVHGVDGGVLDEVLAAYMPGPGSYTGEDVLEFNCHGGPAVLREVLAAVLAAGARPAAPGEFTYRAFRNGRLDLTQAEAVAEAIAAPTRAGLTLAQAKLAGGLGVLVDALRAQLGDLRAQLCVAVDFPEDEVECLAPEELAAGAAEVRAALAGLLAGYRRGRCWREGAVAVLAGRVNAGKSSLMNALLGRERAIVTDVPGTTRDYIEEAVDLDGLPVRLVDTAGLRETDDAVERAGLERSRLLTDQADLVLLVLDHTRRTAPEDVALAQRLGPGKVLAVASKMDLASGPLDGAYVQGVRWFRDAGFETVEVSARTGQGLPRLCRRMRERIVGGGAEPDPGEIVPNLRQSQALEGATAELAALEEDLGAGVPYDLLGVRLETACALLSEITGDIAPADVLDAVFGRFCIGK
ncbi:tRNA uridine-5-carboxymethylaminomethyl(34) synthesis GTPase MnmE [Desulfocurvus sp. DL9XJH121]